MPQPITLYRVFLATPSDVSEELIVVEALLRDWNLQHPQTLGVRLEFVNWRTHTRLATGKRPQTLVHKQAFDACDLVIAIFWPDSEHRLAGRVPAPRRKFGAASNKGKKYWYIFRSAPPRDRSVSSILALKSSSGSLARRRYFGHKHTTAFEEALRNHFASAMHELLKRRPAHDS